MSHFDSPSIDAILAAHELDLTLIHQALNDHFVSADIRRKQRRRHTVPRTPISRRRGSISPLGSHPPEMPNPRRRGTVPISIPSYKLDGQDTTFCRSPSSTTSSNVPSLTSSPCTPGTPWSPLDEEFSERTILPYKHIPYSPTTAHFPVHANCKCPSSSMYVVNLPPRSPSRVKPASRPASTTTAATTTTVATLATLSHRLNLDRQRGSIRSTSLSSTSTSTSCKSSQNNDTDTDAEIDTETDTDTDTDASSVDMDLSSSPSSSSSSPTKKSRTTNKKQQPPSKTLKTQLSEVESFFTRLRTEKATRQKQNLLSLSSIHHRNNHNHNHNHNNNNNNNNNNKKNAMTTQKSTKLSGVDMEILERMLAAELKMGNHAAGRGIQDEMKTWT